MVDDGTTPLNQGTNSQEPRTRRSFQDLMTALSNIKDNNHDFDRYFFESLGLTYNKDLETGGASLVSLAEKSDGTPVAVKISLNPLQNEAENMDLVQRNGGIVPRLKAFGDYPPVIQSEVFSYLQMEYIPGQTLTPEQIDLDTVLRIGIDVAKTLSIAHQHGITHLDVKPGNILYNDGKAYLIDWGSSVLRQVERDTHRGKFDSTLGYTAPERFMDPDAEERLGLADQFSLGASLYRLVTGTAPYNRGDLQNPQELKVVLRYLDRAKTQDRPRLVEQKESDYAPGECLEALDEIVSRMLRPEPLKRYSSCMEVAYVLSQI